MANKYMKECSILVFREMQFKSTKRYYYMLIKENKHASETIDYTKYRRGRRPTETFMHCWRGCQMVLEKCLVVSTKVKHTFTIVPRNPTPRYFR